MNEEILNKIRNRYREIEEREEVILYVSICLYIYIIIYFGLRRWSLSLLSSLLYLLKRKIDTVLSVYIV